MSDKDVNAVSATGTSRVLRTDSEPKPASGKEAPQTGNGVPQAASKQADLEQLAARLNVASQTIGRDLRFKVDMETGRSIIQVLDRETGEIIRQIPAEKAAAMLSGNGGSGFRLYDELI